MREKKDYCRFNYSQFSCIKLRRILEFFKLMGVSLVSSELWFLIFKLLDYFIDLSYDGRLLNIIQILIIMFFFLISIKYFFFKRGFVCLEVLQRKQVFNLKFGVFFCFGIYIFYGRWFDVVVLNTRFQWEFYYLLNIFGNVYIEYGVQQVVFYFCIDS